MDMLFNQQFYCTIAQTMNQQIEMNPTQYRPQYEVMNSDRAYPPRANNNLNPYASPNPNNEYCNTNQGYGYPSQPNTYNGNPALDKQIAKGFFDPNDSTASVGPTYTGGPTYTAGPNSTMSAPPSSLGRQQKGLEGDGRKNFIKKVYMILGIQLLLTVGMCFLSYYCQPFLEFQNDCEWLLWVCLGLILVIQILIFCTPLARKHPYNLILLFLFTLCESYMLSAACAMVAKQQGSNVVVVAALYTLAIVVGLTLYAFLTPKPFNVPLGILVVLVMALGMLGILSIFTWSPFLDNLYCMLSVILFGIYLVIDTQMIIGGKRRRGMEVSMDDYVVGALVLYLDIIAIFMYILELLMKKK